MYNFPVSETSLDKLQKRMEALGIAEADLEETFIRSSGPGGQNVNKVSTCVVLRHKPSGLTVRCQRERSQALNRFLARKQMVDELERRKLGAASAVEQKIWKIRKQKARRGRRAKARMLDDKHHHSDKKSARSPLRPGRDY
jgi:protein subunit release factor B